MEFFPFRRPYYYYARDRYRNMQYEANPNIIKQTVNSNEQEKNNTYKENREVNDSQAVNANVRGEDLSQKEKPIFEIFVIKLFFDDILIVALIFFLYNEGVRDNLLFISLILLLLS